MWLVYNVEIIMNNKKKEMRFRCRSQQAKITMMTPIFVISIFLFALACPCNAQADKSDYIRCQSNTECQPGYCCTIGIYCFSIRC